MATSKTHRSLCQTLRVSFLGRATHLLLRFSSKGASFWIQAIVANLSGHTELLGRQQNNYLETQRNMQSYSPEISWTDTNLFLNIRKSFSDATLDLLLHNPAQVSFNQSGCKIALVTLDTSLCTGVSDNKMQGSGELGPGSCSLSPSQRGCQLFPCAPDQLMRITCSH